MPSHRSEYAKGQLSAFGRAVVVLHDGKQVAESELISFCATRLAAFRVPGRIVFEGALPKTSVGKIQKHRVRASLMD